MSAELEFDWMEVQTALREYAKASSKTEAGIVNKAAKDASFSAIGKTKKARESSIKKHDPEIKRRRGNKNGRLFYALQAKKGKKKGQGIRVAAIKQFNKRKSSIGFLKALHLAVVRDFGGKTKTAPPKRGAASRSRGVPATERKLVATIITGEFEDSAFPYVEDGFKKGLMVAAGRMKSYAEEKMAEDANKFSAK